MAACLILAWCAHCDEELPTSSVVTVRLELLIAAGLSEFKSFSQTIFSAHFESNMLDLTAAGTVHIYFCRLRSWSPSTLCILLELGHFEIPAFAEWLERGVELHFSQQRNFELSFACLELWNDWDWPALTSDQMKKCVHFQSVVLRCVSRWIP